MFFSVCDPVRQESSFSVQTSHLVAALRSLTLPSESACTSGADVKMTFYFPIRQNKNFERCENVYMTALLNSQICSPGQSCSWKPQGYINAHALVCYSLYSNNKTFKVKTDGFISNKATFSDRGFCAMRFLGDMTNCIIFIVCLMNFKREKKWL